MIPATHRDLTHLADHLVPLTLAGVHRRRQTGDRLRVDIVAGADRAADIVRGAGFSVDEIAPIDGTSACSIVATRQWELPDHVGADMRILLVGLNPSPAASDRGIGFARPGNRFWPAMLASGLATVDRDPEQLLVNHRVGMTDLVKRTTARAADLTDREYVLGLERLERLVDWLGPDVVCFVGLQGWRAAVDKRATAGPQSRMIAGRTVYVMPNPSGLNANHRLPDFVEHLCAVDGLAGT